MSNLNFVKGQTVKIIRTKKGVPSVERLGEVTGVWKDGAVIVNGEKYRGGERVIKSRSSYAALSGAAWTIEPLAEGETADSVRAFLADRMADDARKFVEAKAARKAFLLEAARKQILTQEPVDFLPGAMKVVYEPLDDRKEEMGLILYTVKVERQKGYPDGEYYAVLNLWIAKRDRFGVADLLDGFSSTTAYAYGDSEKEAIKLALAGYISHS